MDSGYILLHRKIFDSYVFANEKGLKIWLWCLLRASYKKRFIPLKVGKGQVTIELKEGEFIYGRNKVEELNINCEVVRYWLDKFAAENMILIKPTNQYSIITICNWSSYQSYQSNDIPSNYQPDTNQLPSNNQENTNELPSSYLVDTTYNNVNNINKENKENNKNVYVCEPEILNSLLSFFGFNEQNNFDKVRQATEFFTTLNQKNRIEYFKTQFSAYKEYKAKTAEKVHGFGSFLGDQAQHYANGGWNAESWPTKLKQAKNKPTPGPGSKFTKPKKKTHDEIMKEAAKMMGLEYDENYFENLKPQSHD
jgi:hypothetical protein